MLTLSHLEIPHYLHSKVVTIFSSGEAKESRGVVFSGLRLIISLGMIGKTEWAASQEASCVLSQAFSLTVRTGTPCLFFALGPEKSTQIKRDIVHVFTTSFPHLQKKWHQSISLWTLIWMYLLVDPEAPPPPPSLHRSLLSRSQRLSYMQITTCRPLKCMFHLFTPERFWVTAVAYWPLTRHRDLARRKFKHPVDKSKNLETVFSLGRGANFHPANLPLTSSTFTLVYYLLLARVCSIYWLDSLQGADICIWFF